MTIVSFELKHSFFQGIIKASPSKSYEQRILAAGLMSDQGCIIENFGCSDDVIAARKIVSQLGMHCNIDESGKLVCTKAERKDSSFKSLTLDCGESAMCARFFTPITCLYEVPFILSGSGLLLNRPVADSFEVLAQMGCVFKSKDANLPVLFEKSLLKAGKYIIDGSKSSQFISGLVFSMPTLKDDSQLIIHNPVSFNYILLSIDVLKSFGIIIRYKFDKRRNLEINIPGNQEYRSEQIYKVEGDWSGAANFLVAAAVNGKIVIRGLSETSLQPDKSILNVFDIAGVKYFWDKEVLYVEKSRIKAFDFNATDCPDLIPALVVLAAFADGKSHIYGANRLTNKESSRAIVITEELKKANLNLEVDENMIRIKGANDFCYAKFDSHNDHRIAMALAIFGILSKKGASLTGHECVSKSYPDFYESLNMIVGNGNK